MQERHAQRFGKLGIRVHPGGLEAKHVSEHAPGDRGRKVAVKPFRALEILPELRAYTPSGELAWWAEVKGHLPMPVTEIARGSRLGGPGSHDLMTGLVPGGRAGEVVLQITRTSSEEREPAIARTFVVNVSDRSVRPGVELEGRLLDGGRGFLLVLRGDPYPQLDLYHRPEEDR